ncbi:hypothetical protein OCU04_002965 [Sclerotinia nivalis]|uniref:Uncharacterized protein n=1 Tax=Sclerotinia nivalis TaxID=352851 RepID=A0A9X0AUQ8_9HELO|nr:hypothetical protein OCU04_002965 [Sclerotinia nivalis]
MCSCVRVYWYFSNQVRPDQLNASYLKNKFTFLKFANVQTNGRPLKGVGPSQNSPLARPLPSNTKYFVVPARPPLIRARFTPVIYLLDGLFQMFGFAMRPSTLMNLQFLIMKKVPKVSLVQKIIHYWMDVSVLRPSTLS